MAYVSVPNDLSRVKTKIAFNLTKRQLMCFGAATFLRTVKKYTDIQELTPIILNELVEKIVVHHAQGTGKNRSQQLEIHYNFIGILDTPEVACLPQSILIDTRQGVAVEYITRKAG